MQYIKFYATVLFFCGALWCRAQESTYTLSGVVMDADHEPVYGATVKVGTQTTISDSEGQYRISDIRQRQVRIEASAVGFSSHVQTLTLTQGMNTLQITLMNNVNELETVEVMGLTKAQEVNRQAYNVTAVDATKLYNTTMDIS